jgi:hypothetical protein
MEASRLSAGPLAVQIRCAPGHVCRFIAQKVSC